MAIFRITIRTFQNDEHAALFLAITEQAITALEEKGIKAKAKIGVTQNKKHEVISIWEYDNEAHMKTVRSTLAKFSALPNSLSPKEVSFQADVVKDLFEKLNFTANLGVRRQEIGPHFDTIIFNQLFKKT